MNEAIAAKRSISASLPQLRTMSELTLAGMVQNGIDFLRPLIFNFFVSANLKLSELSTQERAFIMDSVSLASMSISLVCFASASGFNSGIDAYAPVAFGEGELTELHAVLYRQLLLLFLLLAVLVFILVHAEPLLIFTGQPIEKAAKVAGILKHLSWSVPGDLVYDVLARWAKSQQKHKMVTLCVASGLAVNLAVNISAADGRRPLDWPIRALVVQNSTLPVLVFSGLICSGHKFKVTQLGDIFAGLWQQLQTSLQAMVWSCTEMWAWEVQVFEASHLGRGDAATYSILSMTYSLLICLGMGVYPAASALVGEALGAGDHCRAIALMKLACIIGFACVLAMCMILLVLREPYSQAFGGGVQSVAQNVAGHIPLILLIMLVDSQLNTIRTWLVVRKLTAFGAVQSIMCYWLVGVPVGWYLCFRCNEAISGLFSGLGAAVLLILASSLWRVQRDIDNLLGSHAYADDACARLLQS